MFFRGQQNAAIAYPVHIQDLSNIFQQGLALPSQLLHMCHIHSLMLYHITFPNTAVEKTKNNVTHALINETLGA